MAGDQVSRAGMAVRGVATGCRRRRAPGRSRRRSPARSRAEADLPLLLGFRAPDQRPGPGTQQRQRPSYGPEVRHDRRLRLRHHGDHRRRSRAAGSAARGGGRSPAPDACRFLLQGRQLSRHPSAFPERRHRPDDPVHAARTTAATSSKPPFSSPGLLCARQYFDRDSRRGEASCGPHQLALGGGRVELAHAGRPQRALLALEPEQRLEHEPRDPRLERVPDHLCPGRLRAALSDRPEVYHRGWARRPDLHQWARLTTGSSLPLGPDFGRPAVLRALLASSGSILAA